ncbi:MAG: hypothetical protein AABY07_00875 [Nanoarchaeota archaeon]
MEIQELKPKKDRIREWCQSLRYSGYTQIQGKYSDQQNGRCALGVGLEQMNGGLSLHDYFGITPDERIHIMNMNDIYNHSFKDIAFYLEDKYEL